MFERIGTGLSLIKQAVGVLQKDKELLLFPLISMACCILVAASFLVPVIATDSFESMFGDKENPAAQTLMYVGMFAFYFINYFVMTFFNSALVGCAVIRLKGGDPTVGDGFHFATKRLPQIAGWALVSATVGMILKIIESRSERVGEFVSAILGTAWSITTFFVVPVLVVEGLGPVDAFKRSVAIMKKTWGESLVANYGVGFLVGLVSLVGVAPLIIGVMMMDQSPTMAWMLIGLGVFLLILIGLISSALNSIILAALYIYASEDRMPDGFEPELVRGAFARN